MMGSLPILEVYQNTPPLMGYKEGLGIWGVYNFIFLLTIFNSMVGGFGNVKKKPYLCIVIMIQFSYGRGTDCFVGCSKGTCFIYYITPYYGGGELPLIPSGHVFPARSPLPDFLQYKGTDNI
jgi:hypothetical protein